MKDKMKLSAIVELMKAGELVAVVEYRKSIAEVISWRDKVSGKAMKAPVLRHTVETATASVSVAERVPDDWDAAKYTPPFKKGDKVALWVTEWKTERGSVSARGELSPIAEG